MQRWLLALFLVGMSSVVALSQAQPTTPTPDAAPGATGTATASATALAPSATGTAATSATGLTPPAPAPEMSASPAPNTGLPPTTEGGPAWVDADAEEEVEEADPTALTEFEPALAPYGGWAEDVDYGTVWVPHGHVVGPGFAPYVTQGHWALTAGGHWIWVSDYPFGWVVFHYGRWVYTPRYGWVWIAGRRYAPAWVSFRTVPYGDAYLGWAPLPPYYIWRHGHVVWLVRRPPAPYVFCSTRWLFRPGLASYVVVERARAQRFAERSRPYTTTRPSAVRRTGPSLDEARVAVADRPTARITHTQRAPLLRRAATDRTPHARPGPLRTNPAAGRAKAHEQTARPLTPKGQKRAPTTTAPTRHAPPPPATGQQKRKKPPAATPSESKLPQTKKPPPRKTARPPKALPRPTGKPKTWPPAPRPRK